MSNARVLPLHKAPDTDNAAPTSGRTERSARLPVLSCARVVSLKQGQVTLLVAGDEIAATLDPSVDPLVIETALRRGERVLVEDAGGELTVVGALRTQATPGIEEAEEYTLRAGRVRIQAKDEFSVASGTSSFAVRAYGAIETVAEQITSRASAVHRIVGRMLHLN